MATSPTPPPQIAREIRVEARRASRSMAAGLVLVVGTALALFSVAAVALLDYRFGQAPHRLIKLLLGASAMAWIVLQPRVGLFLIPIVTPFLPWVPTLPVPGVNALNILLGAVFATWGLSRVFAGQSLFRPGRLTWPIAGFLLVAGLSVVRGAAFPTGFEYDGPQAGIYLFRCAVMFATYFIALAMARGERDRRLLTWAIIAGLLAESVVTAIYGRTGRGSRAVGSIGQSNDLGAFLAMYAVFAAAFVPAVKTGLARLWLVGTVGIAVFATVLSVSRSALIALAIGLFYVGMRSSRAFTILLVLVAISSPVWAPDYLKERMLGTQVEIEGADDVELEGGAQLRVDTWRAIIEIVTEHPLDGVGFTGLAFVLPETGEALGVDVKDSSHNTYLRCLAEMGILGLGLFLLLLWRCWTLAGAAARAAANRFDRQLGIALAAMTLVLAISCAFGDRFFNVLVVGNFWIACALANDILLERRAPAAPGAPAPAAPPASAR